MKRSVVLLIASFLLSNVMLAACGGESADNSSDATADSTNEVADDTSGDTEDDTSGDTEDDTSGDTEDDTSGDTEDDTSGDTEDDTSGDTEDDTSGDTEDDTSGDTEDDTSGDTADDTSSGVTTCNDVDNRVALATYAAEAGRLCDNPTVFATDSAINDCNTTSCSGSGCSTEEIQSIVDCASQAVQEETDVDDTCGSCYGGLGACAITNCALKCTIGAEEPACTTCITENGCTEEFETCSGLDPGFDPCPDPITNACTTLDNQAAFEAYATATGDDCDSPSELASDALLDECDALNCTGGDCSEEEIQTIAACIGDSVTTTTGIDDACGSCYGEFPACVIANCALSCASGPDAPACVECIDENNCNTALEACSGLDASFDPCPAPITNACTTLDNQAAFEAYATAAGDNCDSPSELAGDTALEECNALNCASGDCSEEEIQVIVDCIADSVTTTTGIDDTCGGCHSERAVCLIANCALDGCVDLSSEACGECINENGCNTDLEICSGLDADYSPCSE